MAHHDDSTTRGIDEAIEGHRFAMVAAASAGGAIDSRPLTLLEHDGATLRFLVARSAPWVAEVGDGAPVNAAFADPERNAYTSLSGRSRLRTDRDLVERLWNPVAGVYFDGKDDPDIAVLEIEVTGGEWWDGPSSKVGQAVDMLKAKVTGSHGAGEHGDVTT